MKYQPYNTELRVPLIEVLTDVEKNALMHLRIMLRKRQRAKQRPKETTHEQRHD